MRCHVGSGSRPMLEGQPCCEEAHKGWELRVRTVEHGMKDFRIYPLDFSSKGCIAFPATFQGFGGAECHASSSPCATPTCKTYRHKDTHTHLPKHTRARYLLEHACSHAKHTRTETYQPRVQLATRHAGTPTHKHQGIEAPTSNPTSRPLLIGSSRSTTVPLSLG